MSKENKEALIKQELAMLDNMKAGNGDSSVEESQAELDSLKKMENMLKDL